MLKAKLRGAGVELVIQEDFLSVPTPYGTLAKLAYEVERVDLIVHLIGAHQSDRAPPREVEELLNLYPDLRPWLERFALIGPALAGSIGYTHWEAFLALYRYKPLTIVRVGRGAQPEHERRLVSMSRFVEFTINSLGDLSDVIPKALERADFDAREGSARAVADAASTTARGWAAYFTSAFVAGVMFQLVSTNWAIGISQTPAWDAVRAIALQLLLSFSFVGVAVAAMTDRLKFGARVRFALRSGFSYLLIAGLVGCAATLFSSENYYWVAHIALWLVLGFAIRSDTKALEEDLGGPPLGTKGATIVRSDHYYYVRRPTVVDALQVSDYYSEIRSR